jgi:hypothetical protein
VPAEPGGTGRAGIERPGLGRPSLGGPGVNVGTGDLIHVWPYSRAP